MNYNVAFSRIAPLLWLRAGGVGERIDQLPKKGWSTSRSYGVLVELDKATNFVHDIQNNPTIKIAYIITDDDRRFQAISKRLPRSVEAVRLYESYLTNFSFSHGE